MLKSQGVQLSVPTTIDIRPVHIQRALHLSEEIYVKNFKLVQMAVYEVYAKDCDIKNYIPNWDDPAWGELDGMNKESFEVQVDNPALTDEELDTMVHIITSSVEDLVELEDSKSNDRLESETA